MAQNSFDQFDQAPAAVPQPQGNSFDQFDATPANGPAPAAAPQPPQQTSQVLGYAKGLETALDNVTLGAKWVANHIPNPLSPTPGPQGDLRIGDAIDKLGGMFGMPSAEQAVAQHKQALADYARQGIKPGALGEFAGDVTATLPTMGYGPIVGGALSGAELTDKTTPGGILQDAVTGAAASKVGQVGLNAVGRVIAPQLSPAVQMLKDMGVQLTPGQILGGWGKRLEDAATSIPFIGDAIRGAQRQSALSFNRAVVNQALKPIGQTLPQNVPAGHEAVSWAGDQLGNAYDALLPNLSAQADHTFANGINTARQGLSSVAPAIRDQFDAAIKQDVLGRFSLAPTGPTTASATLDGQAIKDMESRLGALARNYSSAVDPDQRALGSAFGDVRDELRDLLTRQNPQAADQLSKINNGYAQLTRIERAAGKTSPLPGEQDSGGVFTPQQLLTAVRQADQSMRKRNFARGGALMQDAAEAGKEVLPSSIPDSGTARRMLASGALLGAGGSLLHLMEPTALATTLGIAGGYSPAGRRAIEILLSERPRNAPAVASALVSHLRAPVSAAAASGVEQMNQP